MPTRPARPWLPGLLLGMAALFVVPAFLPLGGGPQAAATAYKTGKAQKPAHVSRDWTRHPAVVEIDTKHDIYALGDVHGDYERLVTLLVAAKLIAADPGRPEAVRWSGGKAVLVCTGDLIDKGNQSLRVLALLQALRTSARASGGRVLVTMGNHEAAFLANPRNKKAKEFLKELKAHGVAPEDLAAGHDALGAGKFLRHLPFAARVNDWFFAHAGNTRGRSLKQLDADLRKGVDAHGFKAGVLLDPDSLLEARLHPHPWWEKGTAGAAAAREQLAGYARALGVKHLVLGHQPGDVKFADGSQRKAGAIHAALDGLVFLIDVGMSSAIGYSNGAVLHIHTGRNPRATALFPSAPPRQLWPRP